MRRRAVLRTGLVALAGVVVGTGQGTGHGATRREDPFVPLDRLAVPGAADCRVSADGETAYLAVGNGFVAVDTPTMAPVAAVRSIEADRDAGPLAGVADVALDGDRLLAPGPANRRPGRTAGFALFDVADPATPRQVAFHETSFPIHNASLADGRAYLTAGQALVVVDVTADDPQVVGQWSLTDADPAWSDVSPALRVLHDVRVRDDLAVLSQWDAGTWLVDVTAPDAATVVGRAGGRSADELAAIDGDRVRQAATRLPGNHHSAALSDDGSLLAVGAEAFGVASGDGTGGPGGIDLYDVTDPTTPTLLATIAAPPAADETRGDIWTTAHDFAFAGGRLVSAWYQGGVRVHDVSTPSEPVQLAWWRRPTEAAFWTARPAADDTFVAPATTLPRGDLFAGLYRFPTRAGEQPNPPSLTEPASPTPTATPSATPTPTPTASPTRTPGQPGLGPGAALGGIGGLLAWRRWRRQG